MRKQYDFSKGIRNPYARALKRQITIRIDKETIAYFQDQATRVGLPYQSLINLYLRDCVESRRKPSSSHRQIRSGLGNRSRLRNGRSASVSWSVGFTGQRILTQNRARP